MTRERILVFFFFCSDLAIQAIRLRLSGVVQQLAKWTLDFIRSTVQASFHLYLMGFTVESLQVSSWVRQNGGWEAVLHSGLQVMHKLAVIGMCAAVTMACVFYIKKNR